MYMIKTFPPTLAGVAIPLKGEVSSEMLYLLHTRSGMFQLTMKGWCWNNGTVVWGRGGGRSGLVRREHAAFGGDVRILGEVLAKGGGDV